MINRNKGKSVLARALKTHRFHSTYIGIVQKTFRCPALTILNYQNHGTIVPPIRVETMASMIVSPWFNLRKPITDASFRVYPAAFR